MSASNTWQQRLYFFSWIAVLFTTLFSWFNLNSFCIILLVLSRFLYQPVTGLKAAFRNAIFLAFLAYCVVGACGFLYTHDVVDQAKAVAREATLVAIVLVWCAGDLLDQRHY